MIIVTVCHCIDSDKAFIEYILFRYLALSLQFYLLKRDTAFIFVSIEKRGVFGKCEIYYETQRNLYFPDYIREERRFNTECW